MKSPKSIALTPLKDQTQRAWAEWQEVNAKIDNHFTKQRIIPDREQVKKLIEKRKRLLTNATAISANYDRTKQKLVDAGRHVLNTFGIEVTLLFIRDEDDEDNNAVVNFYDENGHSIFDQGDAHNITALIVTTYEFEQCRIVFANWNGKMLVLSCTLRVEY